MARLNDSTGDIDYGNPDEFSQYLSSLSQPLSAEQEQPAQPNPNPKTVAPPAPMPPDTGSAPPAPGPTGQQPGTSLDPNTFLNKWRAEHTPGEGLGGLVGAMSQAGYNVSPYMYGSTPSNNEINLNGSKFKVIGAEGTPNAYWYTGGDDSGPGPAGGGGIQNSGGANPGMSFDPGIQNTSGSNPGIGANGGNGAIGGGAGGNDVFSNFMNQLMGQYQQLFDRFSKPVTKDDSFIDPAIQARHAANQQMLTGYREKMASRAAAEGLPTGAFDSQLGNAEMSSGQDEASYGSGLVADENARRESLLSQIFGQGLGAGSLTSSNQLGNRSLSIQDALGQGGLSNQLFLGTGNLNLRNLEDQLNNQHFYDSMSTGMGQNANTLDNYIARLLAGGGGGA